jgi:hypothetical protein
MSIHRSPIPSPDDIDYHRDHQTQRAERAFAALDPGDVLATVEAQLAQESDPSKNPLWPLVNFLLDRQTAVDGAQFYDAWRALVIAAIETCLSEALRQGED